MTAATAPKNTPLREPLASGGGGLPYAMAAATKLWQGTLVALNAAGYAVPAADTASFKVMGLSYDNYDNSAGGNGAQPEGGAGWCVVRNGVAALLNLTGAATQANVGANVFAVDDNTVSVAATTNNIIAGQLLELVSATQAWVWVAGPGTTGP